MAKSFYVTASGPARFSVSGRVYRLEGGDTKGPFRIESLAEVKASTSRHLLHIVEAISNDPEPEPDSITPAHSFKASEGDLTINVDTSDPIEVNVAEKVELFPTDSPSPFEHFIKPEEETIILPEPEVEEVVTGSVTQLVGSELPNLLQTEIETIQPEPDVKEVKPRRPRRTKAD